MRCRQLILAKLGCCQAADCPSVHALWLSQAWPCGLLGCVSDGDVKEEGQKNSQILLPRPHQNVVVLARKIPRGRQKNARQLLLRGRGRLRAGVGWVGCSVLWLWLWLLWLLCLRLRLTVAPGQRRKQAGVPCNLRRRRPGRRHGQRRWRWRQRTSRDGKRRRARADRGVVVIGRAHALARRGDRAQRVGAGSPHNAGRPGRAHEAGGAERTGIAKGARSLGRRRRRLQAVAHAAHRVRLAGRHAGRNVAAAAGTAKLVREPNKEIRDTETYAFLNLQTRPSFSHWTQRG